jgi:hypothetical protein
VSKIQCDVKDCTETFANVQNKVHNLLETCGKYKIVEDEDGFPKTIVSLRFIIDRNETSVAANAIPDRWGTSHPATGGPGSRTQFMSRSNLNL